MCHTTLLTSFHRFPKVTFTHLVQAPLVLPEVYFLKQPVSDVLLGLTVNRGFHRHRIDDERFRTS